MPPSQPPHQPLRLIGEYVALRRTMTRDEFLKAYWTPVLLVPTETSSESEGELTTQVISISAVQAAASKSAGKIAVVPVLKRMKDPFQSFIWVGREGRCDVPLPFDSVSKLQAQFVKKQDGNYDLIDVGSTNGTSVDGVRLGRNQPVPMRDGARVAFGALEVRYRTPSGLWEELGQLAAKPVR